MEFQPKTEPVSPPGLLSGDVVDGIDLMNMSLSGIGAKLRDAIAAKARQEVEVKKMKREILLLSETVKYETWQKRKVEEDLEKVEEELKEQREEEEIAWMIFEEFLETEKKKVLEVGDTIAELRSKNCELEEELKKCNEQCEKGKKAEERYKKSLNAVKKREQEHAYRIAEFKSKNRKLEEELEKCKELCAKGKKAEEIYEELLEDAKKKEQEDGNMISELRSKIRELENEKRKAEVSWKRKFMVLNERVLKLEKDSQLMAIGGGTHVGGNTKEKKHNGIHVHSRESRNTKADSTNWRGIGQSPINPNKDVSASGRLGLRTTPIQIEDYDHDGDAACTSKGALDKKEATSQFITDNENSNSSVAAAHLENTPIIAEGVIGMSKRKLHFSSGTDGFDISDTSSSSSESSESDMEQLLSSSWGHTIDKRRKT